MGSLRDFLPPVKNAVPGQAGETVPVRVESTAITAAPSEPRHGVSKTLALQTDATGRPDFSAIVRQGENATRTVHASRSALVEKARGTLSLARPSAEETASTVDRTRAALAAALSKKQSRGAKQSSGAGTANFLKYTPANAGASQRIVKLVEAPVDPMEPPRFAHKKAPQNPPSPPAPVLHSPERKLSAAEKADWKIPPVVSNWKNPRGYTIALDKRLAADGRADAAPVTTSNRLAEFAEALYVAERTARDDVEKRARFQRSVHAREKEAKEAKLRDLAARARQERSGFAVRDDDPPAAGAGDEPVRRVQRTGPGAAAAFFDDEADDISAAPPDTPTSVPGEDDEGAARRDAVRAERREERARELRQRDNRGNEASGPTLKRSKLTRDRDRDVSERVALGQSAGGGPAGGELMYDHRLFNQGERESGALAGGFGASEAYNLYERPLFAEKPTSSFQYRPKDSALNDKPTAGVKEKGKAEGPRDRPVEFERDEEAGGAANPYGLADGKGRADGGRK